VIMDVDAVVGVGVGVRTPLTDCGSMKRRRMD